jgi:hypothetical protein
MIPNACPRINNYIKEMGSRKVHAKGREENADSSILHSLLSGGHKPRRRPPERCVRELEDAYSVLDDDTRLIPNIPIRNIQVLCGGSFGHSYGQRVNFVDLLNHNSGADPFLWAVDCLKRGELNSYKSIETHLRVFATCFKKYRKVEPGRKDYVPVLKVLLEGRNNLHDLVDKSEMHIIYSAFAKYCDARVVATYVRELEDAYLALTSDRRLFEKRVPIRNVEVLWDTGQHSDEMYYGHRLNFGFMLDSVPADKIQPLAWAVGCMTKQDDSNCYRRVAGHLRVFENVFKKIVKTEPGRVDYVPVMKVLLDGQQGLHEIADEAMMKKIYMAFVEYGDAQREAGLHTKSTDQSPAFQKGVSDISMLPVVLLLFLPAVAALTHNSTLFWTLACFPILAVPAVLC